GGQLAPRLEIMIGRFLAKTALAATRKRTDQDRGLGVDRRTEGGLREGGSLAYLLESLKDGVGFLHFFWGRLLTTVGRRKPRSLSFAPMVCTVGNCSSVYPLNSMSCLRTSCADSRQYNRVVWNVGSVWSESATRSRMS